MRRPETAFDGVSFDLFGTLVTVAEPADPAEAVAAELESRGVPVPGDWNAAYAESHVDVPDGAELSLAEHVAAVLASRSASLRREDVRDDAEVAVRAAFDVDVRTRPDAVRAVDALADRVPIGILSNCSVPTLAERVLEESDIDGAAFDAVVTSVGCGWRKPDRRAFEAVSRELTVDVDGLLHVGDDPDADGGAAAAGAASLLVEDGALARLANGVEGRWG